MDQSSHHSNIPRPSRLPLPTTRAGHSLRLSPSQERLRADSGIDYSKLHGPRSPDEPLLSPNRLKPSTTPRTSRRLSSGYGYGGTLSNGSSNASLKTLKTRRSSSQFRGSLRLPSSQGQWAEDAVADDVSDAGSIAPTAADQEEERPTRRQPRLSLSERTVETLSQFPPLPSPRGQSGFFQSDKSMPPPMRPASAMNTSRPSSRSSIRSSGISGIRRPASPTKRSLAPRASMSNLNSTTSSKRSISMAPLRSPMTMISRSESQSETISPAKTPTEDGSMIGSVKTTPDSTMSSQKSILWRGSKTLAARPSKTRPSLADTFQVPLKSPKEEVKESLITDRPIKVSNSSAALRETIARAKKAKAAQAAKKAAAETAAEPVQDATEIEYTADPFNTGKGNDNDLLHKKIDAGRTSGSLNIAAMNLKQIPDEVMNMYEFDSSRETGTEWYESVDLVKFIAADNEIEEIREDAFPDIDPQEELGLDDETRGNQFGGLESLDFHGNILRSIPIGLRRMERLTMLNLSHNKLGNECFEIISQIPSLKDLRLPDNALDSCLPENISELHSLEFLDLRNNTLNRLPEKLSSLKSLRVLQLSQNDFSSISFEVLSQVPLTELAIAQNQLSGSLISEDIQTLPKLQVLDISENKLSSLTAGDVLNLPSLQQLKMSANRITSLPNVSSWEKLLVLSAADNNISEIPEGFFTLSAIRNVDLTGNGLTKVDVRISLMESLNNFLVANNPLRERKFLTMSTEELKEALRQRLVPEEPESDLESVEEKESSTDMEVKVSPGPVSEDPAWSVRPGGLLDRSSCDMEELDADRIKVLADKQDIRTLDVRHNLFQTIPSSITHLQQTLVSLNLSHNNLTGANYVPFDISLCRLKDLVLSSNSITALDPLIQHLEAPVLEHLEVSCNRLTELPVLRTTFPKLISILAADNVIEELDVEAVRGLRALDVSRNSVRSLPPKLGLLQNELKSLEVTGNTFRVPQYNILEKGTEALLAWLKDKIPLDEREDAELSD